MNELRHISRAYERAKVLELVYDTKLVLISDCHRGTGGGADSLAQNQNLYYYALRSYYRMGYTYIELGDGDELWKNRHMEDILAQYDHIFDLLSDFHREGRMYMLYGNHDMVKKSRHWTEEYLSQYHAGHTMTEYPLFPKIKVLESILLLDAKTGGEMLLLHGHQADFFNDQLWRLSRFLVRHIWRPLELIGFRVPVGGLTLHPKRRDKVEKLLTAWCDKNKAAIVAGHTHRPVFPNPGETPYFNDGSCVHPRYITALEITGRSLALVKWEVLTRDDGTLYISKSILTEGKLSDYLGRGWKNKL